MPLTLLPTSPSPFRADAARDEVLRLWEGLNLQGQRLVLAHIRAVAELTGKLQRGDAEA